MDVVFLGGVVVGAAVAGGSGEGHVRSVDGVHRRLDVLVVLAVQVLGVALDAVAAVHLRQGRGHVGGGAEDVGVGEGTAELHALLVPVSP